MRELVLGVIGPGLSLAEHGKGEGPGVLREA